ncbi:hypothetical protein [Pseudoalteromonas byunsanensis]|uniref:Uncharacterized protein n=1 Tax=Pseudoalteromonas byunsanensis TaxID=327939 RepID=A0A1S1NB91_9GAMM|nr:hypothetical protein [Pseudoalteromonas byunsanensis]OHU96636.1 hypothetical protein BIW53_04715 [Pseudoalteromonas byunsanensis]
MTVNNNTLKHYYKQGFAKQVKDANRCYYCGCEATDTDYCPPLEHAELVLEFSENADFISVPACYECYAMLHNERVLTLAERVDKLKTKLAGKYAKALKVYHMWHEAELDEMSPEFQHSIAAGMSLGGEAASRLAFVPFILSSEDASEIKPAAKDCFIVNEQEFTSFDDALSYCFDTFGVQKSRFYDLLVKECAGDFDKALSQYQHRYSAPKVLDVGKEKIKAFAKQHKQNSDFVARATERLMKQDAKLDIDAALAKLYREYIAR